MLETTRRAFLRGAAASAAALYVPEAHATLMRGLSLQALVSRSERIAVLEPFETSTRYAIIGGRKSLVTDTRVGVHADWGDAAESELTLRTLGGRLDGVAELVHGQPVLELGVRAVAFLKRGRHEQAYWAIGMAQGHFPLTDNSEASRLLANRGLPRLLHVETSAVRRLVGRQLNEAHELVRRVRLR
jgi:hypothetical protein